MCRVGRPELERRLVGSVRGAAQRRTALARLALGSSFPVVCRRISSVRVRKTSDVQEAGQTFPTVPQLLTSTARRRQVNADWFWFVASEKPWFAGQSTMRQQCLPTTREVRTRNTEAGLATADESAVDGRASLECRQLRARETEQHARAGWGSQSAQRCRRCQRGRTPASRSLAPSSVPLAPKKRCSRTECTTRVDTERCGVERYRDGLLAGDVCASRVSPRRARRK